MPSRPLAAKRSHTKLLGSEPSTISIISYSCPPSPTSLTATNISIAQASSLVLALATSTCMDSRHHDHPDLPYRSQRRGRGSSYGSALPQTQWTDVPLPYRPREWSPLETQTGPPPFAWRLRPPPSGAPSEEPHRAHSLAAPRRRPPRLRSLVSGRVNQTRETHLAADVASMYPHMSPYDPQPSARSAPELEIPRAISQPNTPSWLARQYEPGEAHSMQLPRSPTYPPMGRSRGGRGGGDEAFDDDADFRLFVEATSGLNPEQHYRQSSSSGSSRRREHISHDNRAYTEDESLDSAISPLDAMPTPLATLAQLTTYPQSEYQPSALPLSSVSQSQGDRLQASVSNFDLWLQSQRNNPRQHEVVADVSPIEEELPDYASSQAQAHAQSRAEATRRAQELQRRWQESGAGRAG